METEEWVNKRVSVMKRVVKATKWSELSVWWESIDVNNVDECERHFLSEVLNIARGEVDEEWKSNLDFVGNLEAFIKNFLQVDLFGKDKIYTMLLQDSVVPKSEYMKSFLESSVANSTVLFNVFVSESFHKVYSYVEEFKLVEEVKERIKITVISEKSAAVESDSRITYMAPLNREFSLKDNLDNNILVIGKNKSSSVIDVNMFNDEGNEDVIGIIALKYGGIYVADLSSELKMGVMVIGSVPLYKNSVFKLGYFACLSVLNLRSSWSPYIQLMCDGNENSFTFENITEEILIGKESGNINCLIHGVSGKHCKIYFDQINSMWMLESYETEYGTYMLLKNLLEYRSKSPSTPKNLGFNEIILAFGTHKIKIQRS